jgi:hypothetical protein
MPLVNITFSAINRVKYFVTRYLNIIFTANKKGMLLFTDGTEKIEFSKFPYVGSMHGWVSRDIPAILIGPTTATYVERSFSSNLLKNAAALDVTDTRVYRGGDLDLDMSVYVRCSTLIELDRLVDTVCIVMAKKEAKDYFILQDIKLPKPPRAGASTEVNEPSIDYPLYETPIELTFRATWVEWTEIGDRLIDIIVDIDAELDL